MVLGWNNSPNNEPYFWIIRLIPKNNSKHVSVSSKNKFIKRLIYWMANYSLSVINLITLTHEWMVLEWNKSLDIEPYFWIIRLIPKMWYMLFSNRKIFYQLQWELIVIALVLWEMDNFTCLITITRFFTEVLCTCNLVNVAIEILSHKATENINHDHIKLLTMY